MNDPETVGTEIADAIETVIEESNDAAERAAEVNEQLIEAAVEGERGRRLDELERRFSKWESNQEQSSQAIAALAMGMERVEGQISALLSTQQPPPTPNPPSAADGPRESQEEIQAEVPPAIHEPVAHEPEPPPPAPPARKKKKLWI